MEANLFRKRPCLPALHPRGDDGDVIDTTGLHRNISTNGIKTRAAKQLACTGYVFDADEPIVVHRSILEWSAHETEPRIPNQSAQKKCKIVRVERDVRVHAADGVVVKVPHSCI